MGQLRDEHAGHAVERRAALLAHRLQGEEGIEGLSGRHDTRAMSGAAEVADHHSKAVVEGHGDADAVLLRVAEGLAEEVGVVEDVVVGEGRALGCAGGARGVLDVDGIVELQPRFPRGQVLLGHARGAGAERVPIVFEDDRLAQVRAVAPHLREHPHVVAGAERAREEQEPHPRLPQRVAQLRRLVRRVDVHEDRSRPGRGVLGHHPLEPVGGPDAHALPGLDPAREQGSRHHRGLGPELSIGGPVALRADDQGVPLRETLGGAAEILADRLPEKGNRAGAVGVGEHDGTSRRDTGGRARRSLALPTEPARESSPQAVDGGDARFLQGIKPR